MKPTNAIQSRGIHALLWLFLGAVLVFLYAPLLPPLIHSFRGTDAAGGFFANYAAILDDPQLMQGIKNTAIIGLAVAVITPILALAVAQAIREWRRPRLLLSLVLLPLFVPGVSMGVATAIFFKTLDIDPSLFTMIVVQVLWALPFATLIIMTVMSSFEGAYLEAAYLLGSNRFQAFWNIELPHIQPGLGGAAAFALILSFNETIRTSIVQGRHNTLQTYLWAQYKQVGLSPTLYALMTLLILVTLLVMLLIVLKARGARSNG
tara:strand:+ start:2659 stop:3447 length:789 start_codon:yes stop_codon:yes gene_type:complete